MEHRHGEHVGPVPAVPPERAETSTPPAAPADPVLQVPSFLALELVKLARRTAHELFPDEQLRPGHTAALAWLADHGPLSQRELSEQLRMDPGDLVGVIDSLERSEYAERRRDPQDRRRYAVHITEEGRQALHDRRARAERLNEALFAPLTPHELDQLKSLILKVLAHHDTRFRALRAARDIDDRATPERLTETYREELALQERVATDLAQRLRISLTDPEDPD